MRDDQVRRYARHILLPDVGGLGQTALLVATARLDLRASEPEAALICATYLAAGGTGTLVLPGATPPQLAAVAAHGPDTRVVADAATLPADAPAPCEVQLAPPPAWWPSAEGDHAALACWRGALAAVRWMADLANR